MPRALIYAGKLDLFDTISMNALFNYLHLIYPPISNQEADWLQDDEEVRELVMRSKLYMAAQRQELLFSNLKPGVRPEDAVRNGKLVLELTCGNVQLRDVLLPTDQFGGRPGETLDWDLGPKLIKVSGEDGRLLRWFTPDKLLWDFSNGRVKATGLGTFRDLLRFDLLYVGISKKEDSFARLFDQGHKARTAILSNETQINPTARLTDELVLFFFDIEDAIIRTYSEGADFTKFGKRGPDKTKIIADAEKAFAKILQPKYNKVKYDGYPKGTDGLYDEGLDLYGYKINEELTFTTPTTSIEGVNTLRGGHHRSPDVIYIQGDTVELVKSKSATLPTTTYGQ